MAQDAHAMKATSYGTTHQGKVRDVNEDHFAIALGGDLIVVCDGLGGHAAGEVASKTAVEVAVRHVTEQAALLQEALLAKDGHYAVRILVDEAINEASRAVCELAESCTEYAGMGTTLTLGLLWSSSLVVGHVGDCRIYLLRDGELQRLTSDHTMAAELCRRGQLAPEEVEKSQLSHALTRVVGAQSAVLVDTSCLNVLPGDAYLVCTDGLYRYFDDLELTELLAWPDLSGLPEALTSLAIERGGADNITSIVIQVPRKVSQAAEAKAETVQRRLDALTFVPFLSQLSSRHLSLVLEVMESRNYESGELVLAQGQLMDGLYVLVDGDVSGLGSNHGDYLGERDLTRTEPAETELRAQADSEVLYLGASPLRSLVRRHPVLCTRLFWSLLTRGIVESGSTP
ncbi:MAG: serine/threonine protein phosphatase PrpC [Candidatus Paceibacteria bacterium]|jgi:serine/threonine protein phosphatase PrpC